LSRYAISDIHGCYKTFRYLVEKTIKLKSDDQLFLLGDYIDRGPSSKNVIDFILELRDNGYQITTLKGNHEELMLQAQQEFEHQYIWYINGGKETLTSFGVNDLNAIPEKYWQFLHQLDYYTELEDYLLVHAGFNFSAEQPFQDYKSMLWIRDFDIDETWLKHKKIIHGHTPTALTIIEKTVTNPMSKVIDIDGGCVFKMRLGYLTALNLDTAELHAIRNLD